MANIYLCTNKISTIWGNTNISYDMDYTKNQLNITIHVTSLSDYRTIQKSANFLANKFTEVTLSGNNWNKRNTIAFNRSFDKPNKKCIVKNPIFLLEEVTNIIDKIKFVRNLTNETAEIITPQILIRKIVEKIYNSANKVGKSDAISYTILEDENLKNHGYMGIFTVGKGSFNKPSYLVLDFNPTKSSDTPVFAALVGKGITFDTGGLSIKSSNTMLAMKADMGGSALITGSLCLAIESGLDKRIKIYIPAAENSISSNSFRPSDIITYRNGITVEVEDTDAEGRLVLADALIDASNDNPKFLIDVATLTGVAKVALGTDYHAVLSFDDSLANKFLEISKSVDERFWRLPLDNSHREITKGVFGYISNQPQNIYNAGASIAAAFLSYFIKQYKHNWIHIDASQTYNRGTSDEFPYGATGIGVESIAALLLSEY